MKGLLCESAQYSLLGNRHENEDRSLILRTPNITLVAVADGMGGHPKGEVAAQILIDTCQQQLKKSRQSIAEPKKLLKELLLTAHERIVAFGNRQEPPIQPRTTAVVCLIQGGEAFWAHAGDSRLYLIRNSLICARTKDHSYIQHLKSQGVISEAQGGEHPRRNYVTRCLGGSQTPPKVSVGTPCQLEADDILLLCSDGFWGQIDERLAVQTLSNQQVALPDSLQRLTHLAERMANPKSDNVTAIALRWLPIKRDGLAVNFANSVIDNDQKKEPADDELKNAIDTLRQAVDNFDLENH